MSETPRLSVVKGKDEGKEYPLEGEVLMGREGEVDIRVRDTKASRKHTKIVQSAGAFFAVDLGSRNGTQVNGAKIKRVRLKPGDRITIGTTEYEFRGPAAKKARKPRTEKRPPKAPPATSKTAVTETMTEAVQPRAPAAEAEPLVKVRNELFDPERLRTRPRDDRAPTMLTEDLAQRPALYQMLVWCVAVVFLFVLAWLSYKLTLSAVGG